MASPKLSDSLKPSSGKTPLLKTPGKPPKQVTVKDREGSIDLTSGDGGDAEFQRSHTE